MERGSRGHKRSQIDGEESASKRQKPNRSTPEEETRRATRSSSRKRAASPSEPRSSSKRARKESSEHHESDQPSVDPIPERKKQSSSKKQKKRESKKRKEDPTPAAVEDPHRAAGAPRAAFPPRDFFVQPTPRGFTFDPMSASHLNTLLDGIRAMGEDDHQLVCLGEVCEFLAMANEESMGSFSVDNFVPALVALINCDYNPDIMLLAMRALCHMMEAQPSSSSAVVGHGAIPSFVGKLILLEYIDVAEVAIQALEKVSYEHGLAVLKADGLNAVLNHMDFFNSGLQRSAVSVAANVCRQMSSDNFGLISSSVPILTNILNYRDKKLLETVCLAFARLIESVQDNEDHLIEICSHGLLGNSLNLIGEENKQLVSPATHTLIIRMLGTICKSSSTLTLQLLNGGVAHTLKAMLGGQDTPAGPPDSPMVGSPGGPVGSPSSPFSMFSTSPAASSSFSAMRSTDQLLDILVFANDMLPALEPKCPVAASSNNLPFATFSSGLFGRSSLRAALRRTEQKDEKDADGKTKRERMLEENPGLLLSYAEALFPILLSTATTTVNQSVRAKCISTITKVLHYGQPSMLTELLKNIPVSSSIARLMSGRDLAAAAAALEMAEILITKMPDIFEKFFRREGVFHEVAKLAAQEPPSTPSQSSPAAPADPSPPGSAKSKTPFSKRRSKGAARMPPSPFESPSGGDEDVARQTALRKWVYEEAARFQEAYMKDDTADGDELLLLRETASSLTKASNAEEEKASLLKIRDLIIMSADGVSTYEFIGSGIVASLVEYLVGAQDASSDAISPAAKERLSLFCDVFGLRDSTTTEASAEVAPLRGLVGKLQEAFSKHESFPVLLCSPASSHLGLRVLTQPFKLRLQREGDELTGDDSLSSSVVLIEPLATIGTIEQFLLSKISPEQVSELEGRGLAIDSDREDDDGDDDGDDGAGASAADSIAQAIVEEEEEDDDDDDDDDDGSLDDEYGEGEEDELLPQRSEPVHDVAVTPGADGKDEAMPEVADSTTSAMSKGKETGAGPAPVPSSTTGGAARRTAERRSRGGAVAALAAARGQQRLEQRGGGGGAQRRARGRTQHVLALYHGDALLDYDLNIFQCIQASVKEQVQAMSSTGETDSVGAAVASQGIWDEVYTIRYRVLTKEIAADMRALRRKNSGKAPVEEGTVAAEDVLAVTQPLRGALSRALPRGLLADDAPLRDVCVLLRLLRDLCAHHGTLRGDAGGPRRVDATPAPALPDGDFVNAGLAAKFMRQLQDPLTLCSSALPAWCTDLVSACGFLFPFDCRRLYFYSTSFGVARALMRLQESREESSFGREAVKVGRIQRQKVRIARAQMLESAVKVMDLYCSNKAILEVEYFDEVGTGLGPTLEFYSKVSHELQKKSLDLWRSEMVAGDDPSPYVHAPLGLFPRPLAAAPSSPAAKAVARRFRFVGRFVGKALLDSRLVDLPLSPALHKFMRGECLAVQDIRLFDVELLKSIEGLLEVVEAKRAVESDPSLSDDEKTAAINALTIKNARIEDLCLDFTLPGYAECELKEGGADIPVTIHSLEEYLRLYIDKVIGSGVAMQLTAFARGFNEVFPMRNLAPFSSEEIDMLMLGTDDAWEVSDLIENTKTDHGYEHQSDAVRFLFEVMHEFGPEERRNFLKFISGSPRLPFGGWSALNPKLTIVQKTVSGGAHPDEYMPSVMTCANYLKLPRYSSKEVLKAKLMRAMTDGQESFLLS